MHNLWEHAMGEKMRGGFIETHNVILKGNKMIFDFETRGQKKVVHEGVSIIGGGTQSDYEMIFEKLHAKETFQHDLVSFQYDTVIYEYGGKGMDTLILKYQYFSTMKVMDPKTKKTGKYTMKGANWTNYAPFIGRKRNKLH